MKIEVIPILNLKKHGATSTLLVLDETLHLLLDCGLNQKLDFKRYKVYWDKYMSKVDVILLSHTGLEYTGALPFLLSKMDKIPQIFCTPPIKKFGLFNLYDAFLNITVSKDDRYDNEKFFNDIHKFFEDCHELRFYQSEKVSFPKNQFQQELIISCQGAGNSLGACVWTIKCNLINIMYLVSYNHYNELHLDGIDFQQLLKSKIDVLVTDSNHNESIDPLITSSKENRTILKKKLLQKIEQAHASNSNLILCCYPNERIVEVVFILHQIFKENPKVFEEYKVDFYRNYKQYIDQLKMHSSFMSHEAEVAIQQKFDSPFLQEEFVDEFKRKYYPFLNVRRDLVPDNPESNKFVLTTYNVLFIGPLYNYLLQQLAPNNNNQLLIIGRPEQDLFEATLQIKANFTGQVHLQRGDKDKPQLNALEDYIVNDTLVDEEELKMIDELQVEDGGETDLMSLQNKIETNSMATTMHQSGFFDSAGTAKAAGGPGLYTLLGDQSQKNMKKSMSSTSYQNQQQNNQSQSQQQQQLQLQQQEQLQQEQFNLSFPDQQNELQQSQQQLQQKQGEEEDEEEVESVQGIVQEGEEDEEFEGPEYLKPNKLNREILFSQKKFPRYYQKPETITLTDYGHDTEGLGTSKLQKHNVVKLIKEVEESLEPNKGREVAKQLFSNFVKLDLLQGHYPNSLEQVSLDFQMQVSEFPLKGISDMASAINIISLINPQHIVLVNGGKEEHLGLIERLSKKFQAKSLHSPGPGEPACIELANESLDIDKFYFSETQKKQFEIENGNNGNNYNNNNNADNNIEEEGTARNQLSNNDKTKKFKKVAGEIILKYSRDTEQLDIELFLSDDLQFIEKEEARKAQEIKQQQKTDQLSQQGKESASNKYNEGDMEIETQQLKRKENDEINTAEEDKQQLILQNQLFIDENLNTGEEEKVEQEFEYLEDINLRIQKFRNQEDVESENNKDLQKEFYGDFQFQSLIQLLIHNNIKCQVQKGTLQLYGGKVIIEKQEGTYILDGCYGQEYFAVRKVLYQFLNQNEQN